MKHTILFSLIFLLGFLVAIPAGPVQVEVVRRAVNGHLKSSFMVVLGAFLIDVSYGIVAFFGIAPFLESRTVMSVFWLGGSLILGVLGYFTISHSGRVNDTHHRSVYLSRKRWSFLSGVSLSMTNPVMVLWWLSSLNIFRDLGMVPAFTTSVALAYLAAGSLGLAAYLLLLSIILYRVKDFLSLRNMRHINIALGIFLLFLSVYFLVHAVMALK
jgi:threonine/homoserine/homoserine lactone efflux protein